MIWDLRWAFSDDNKVRSCWVSMRSFSSLVALSVALSWTYLNRRESSLSFWVSYDLSLRARSSLSFIVLSVLISFYCYLIKNSLEAISAMVSTWCCLSF